VVGNRVGGALGRAVFGWRGKPGFGRNMAQREYRKGRGETDRSDTTEAERPTSIGG
jgi:hypothetical protein